MTSRTFARPWFSFHSNEADMHFTKLPVPTLPLAFVGAAATLHVSRRYARLRDAKQHENHLRTWEGEGGTSAPSTGQSALGELAQ